jgi:hypothetical protein
LGRGGEKETARDRGEKGGETKEKERKKKCQA